MPLTLFPFTSAAAFLTIPIVFNLFLSLSVLIADKVTYPSNRRWRRHQQRVVTNIPNRIGYVRLYLLGAALCIADTHPDWFFVLYGASQALDAIDGWAARRFRQESTFGIYLDMLTDRVSTLTLYMLIMRYCALPYRCWLALACLASLDVVSHWIHMVASLLTKAKSHKHGTACPLLRAYYEWRVTVMLPVCVGSEVTLLALYACTFEQTRALGTAILPYSASFMLWKTLIHAAQLVEAGQKLLTIKIKSN